MAQNKHLYFDTVNYPAGLHIYHIVDYIIPQSAAILQLLIVVFKLKMTPIPHTQQT